MRTQIMQNKKVLVEDTPYHTIQLSPSFRTKQNKTTEKQRESERALLLALSVCEILDANCLYLSICAAAALLDSFANNNNSNMIKLQTIQYREINCCK